MSVRAVPVVLLALCACDDLGGGGGVCESTNPGGCESWARCVTDPADPRYGQCGGEIYRCEDGEWVLDGWCEPFPISIEGDLTLHQTIASTEGACPALAPRDPLVLTASLDAGTVTAADPIVVTSGTISSGFRDATAEVTLTDDWSGVAVTAYYDLYLRWDGVISGAGTATVDACTAVLDVTGTFEPEWLP